MAEAEPRRLPDSLRRKLQGKPCRIKALHHAHLYVGVREDPPGSNRGPHIDRWCRWANGLVGYPWCAAFVCGMYREACGLIIPEPRRASVGFLERWALDIGLLVKPGTRPRRGDLICYRFDTDDWPDHIGIVDRVLATRWVASKWVGYVRTVEGNTSAGDDANGGQVQIRWRRIHDGRVRFIRVDATRLKKAK